MKFVWHRLSSSGPYLNMVYFCANCRDLKLQVAFSEQDNCAFTVNIFIPPGKYLCLIFISERGKKEREEDCEQAPNSWFTPKVSSNIWGLLLIDPRRQVKMKVSHSGGRDSVIWALTPAVEIHLTGNWNQTLELSIDSHMPIWNIGILAASPGS